MLPDMSNKNVDIEAVAKLALADEKVMMDLLANLVAKNEKIRFNSFNALMRLADKQPTILYPKWDAFVDLLVSKNSYHQYIAIFLIANLVQIDLEKKFERIFDKYYNNISEKFDVEEINHDLKQLSSVEIGKVKKKHLYSSIDIRNIVKR